MQCFVSHRNDNNKHMLFLQLIMTHVVPNVSCHQRKNRRSETATVQPSIFISIYNSHAKCRWENVYCWFNSFFSRSLSFSVCEWHGTLDVSSQWARPTEWARQRAIRKEMHICHKCPYLTYYTFAAPSTPNVETLHLPNHQVIILCILCIAYENDQPKKKRFCICTQHIGYTGVWKINSCQMQKNRLAKKELILIF